MQIGNRDDLYEQAVLSGAIVQMSRPPETVYLMSLCVLHMPQENAQVTHSFKVHLAHIPLIYDSELGGKLQACFH